MKKIIIFLILMLIPFIAKAEVKITNVELIENSEDLIATPTPAFEKLNITFNIKFQKVDEYAKYVAVIKNDTEKEYEITSKEEFSEGEYIKYVFELEKSSSTIIKPHEEKVIYITVIYNKQVPDELFKDGYYKETNNMSISMINNETNPNTKVGYTIFIAAIIMFIALLFVIFNKYKLDHLKILLITGIILVPLTIYAVEKITIKIDTIIEIPAPEKEMAIRAGGCDGPLTNGLIRNIKYKAGMTFGDFVNSEYFTNLEGKTMTNGVLGLDTPSDYEINRLKQFISQINSPIKLMTYPAEFVRCTDKVRYAYYLSTNITEEEQAAEDAYMANFHACEQEFQVDGIYGREFVEGNYSQTIIKPQTEIVYRYASFC